MAESLTKLFANVAEGKLENKQLAQRVNSWLPANFRRVEDDKLE